MATANARDDMMPRAIQKTVRDPEELCYEIDCFVKDGYRVTYTDHLDGKKIVTAVLERNNTVAVISLPGYDWEVIL